MTARIKYILTTCLVFISAFSFSQEYAFKCCNESNTHKRSCENFNKIQEWEIELDSVYFGSGSEVIKSNFSGTLKIKLNRADSTFKLSITNHNRKKPYLNLEYKYLDSHWSVDCDGNEFPELGITLVENGKEIFAGGYYWSEAGCRQEDFYLYYSSFRYLFSGKVKVIDK
jgi:hypothetical protein